MSALLRCIFVVAIATVALGGPGNFGDDNGFAEKPRFMDMKDLFKGVDSMISEGTKAAEKAQSAKGTVTGVASGFVHSQTHSATYNIRSRRDFHDKVKDTVEGIRDGVGKVKDKVKDVYGDGVKFIHQVTHRL